MRWISLVIALIAGAPHAFALFGWDDAIIIATVNGSGFHNRWGPLYDQINTYTNLSDEAQEGLQLQQENTNPQLEEIFRQFARSDLVVGAQSQPVEFSNDTAVFRGLLEAAQRQDGLAEEKAMAYSIMIREKMAIYNSLIQDLEEEGGRPLDLDQRLKLQARLNGLEASLLALRASAKRAAVQNHIEMDMAKDAIRREEMRRRYEEIRVNNFKR